jgi:pilus assembly protein CpaB
VLLIALAVVGAIATFVSVANYVAETRRLVGPDVAIVKLSQPVPAYSPIPDDGYRVETIPEKFLPEGAMGVEDIGGLVAGTALEADTVLQEGLLIPPPRLEEGQQEIAVTVDAETGVAGQVQPGNRVDIYATFEGEEEGERDCVTLLIKDAPVLVVGTTETTTPPEAVEDGVTGPEAVVAVTFALDGPNIEKLVYAESFATEVRLALRRPLDTAGKKPGACGVPPGVSPSNGEAG